MLFWEPSLLSGLDVMLSRLHHLCKVLADGRLALLGESAVCSEKEMHTVQRLLYDFQQH